MLTLSLVLALIRNVSKSKELGHIMRQHKGYSEHTKELALGEEYLCRIKKGKARELKKPIKLTLDHLLTYNL